MLGALLLTIYVTALAFVSPAVAPELSRYRGIALGNPLPMVAQHLQVALSDVAILHERPTLVQQITWRPHPMVSGTSANPDSVSEVVLTFHAGRLARIAVGYDRERTAGLTNADLLEAFQLVYGPSLLPSNPIRTTASSSDREVVGSWQDAEARVVLWRDRYPNRVGLTIASITADLALQQAIEDGGRLDASEAPARNLARQAAEATAIRTRDEKLRRDNKATFKP